MYRWRDLSDQERAQVLAARQRDGRPWHSPPHWRHDGPAWFHLTAACYEHAPHIGWDFGRMDFFSGELLAACSVESTYVAAWCLLPNHYHLLLEISNLQRLLKVLGQIHGRSSRAWNLEDGARGRRVFHRTADRQIRSEGHFWATLNYIHHNPVRHGYVALWSDWPWSSASDYLNSVGRAEATRIWCGYPVLDYGEDWDNPSL